MSRRIVPVGTPRQLRYSYHSLQSAQTKPSASAVDEPPVARQRRETAAPQVSQATGVDDHRIVGVAASSVSGGESGVVDESSAPSSSSVGGDGVANSSSERSDTFVVTARNGLYCWLSP